MSAFWTRLPGSNSKSPGRAAAARGWAASLLTGLAAFVVYLDTLAPSVMSLDAGRFQIAAPLLGTAHPTGYPTFTLLAHLFTYLPFGDVAYRVNLLSAVAGAVAVALFVPVARRLGAPALPAAGTALLYAFSTTFWGQATRAEVYTLHAAFLLAVLLLLLRWRSGRRGRDLLLAAGLFGLALGNNAGTVLLAPAYLLLILDRGGRPSPGIFAGALGAGFAGLSVYAYLPIRGFAGAWHNYGDPVKDWGDVWRLVSGSRFQRLMDPSPDNLLRGADRFWGALLSQTPQPLGPTVGLLLVAWGAVGAAILVRRQPTVGLALLTALAATLLYAMSYRIADVAVYYLPVYLLLALFLSVALGAISQVRLSDRPGLAGRLPALISGLPLALAALALVLGHGPQDRSRDYTQRTAAERTLATLPEGAVLYGRAEILSVTYLVEVEGERPDVALRWLHGYSVGEDIPANLKDGRPVYLFPLRRGDRSPDGYPKELDREARAVREGRLIHLVPREGEP